MRVLFVILVVYWLFGALEVHIDYLDPPYRTTKIKKCVDHEEWCEETYPNLYQIIYQGADNETN